MKRVNTQRSSSAAMATSCGTETVDIGHFHGYCALTSVGGGRIGASAILRYVQRDTGEGGSGLGVAGVETRLLIDHDQVYMCCETLNTLDIVQITDPPCRGSA